MSATATKILCSGLLLALACGGATTPAPDQPTAPVADETPAEQPPAAEPAPAEPETAPAPLQSGDWANMEKEARAEHMKKVVMPRLAALFKQHDPDKYADVSCKLCHGSKVKDGVFDMPNPELPVIESFDKVMKEHPEMTKFMAETVEPTVAVALGLQPYDPKTGEGFGCKACHVIGKKGAAK